MPTTTPILLSPSTATADPEVDRKITGQVFEDANGNGKRDPGEPGVAGVSVFVDGEEQGETNSQGEFSFSLGGKKANLSIVPPKGWEWAGNIEEISTSDTLAHVAIPVRKVSKVSLAADAATSQAAAGGAAAVALLAVLAFTGAASLAQAAAVRSLENTYRRQKSQELELAMASELGRYRETLETRLRDNAAYWREIAKRLLSDAHNYTGGGALMVSDVSPSMDDPSFTIIVEGQQYVFTTTPNQAKSRRQDLVIPLDSAVSPYARIEAQLLWSVLVVQRTKVERAELVLPRKISWYLVVRGPEDLREKLRLSFARRRTWWVMGAVAVLIAILVGIAGMQLITGDSPIKHSVTLLRSETSPTPTTLPSETPTAAPLPTSTPTLILASTPTRPPSPTATSTPRPSAWVAETGVGFLRVRAEPGGDEVGRLPVGSEVMVLNGPMSHSGSSYDWYEVETSEVTGWVAGEYLVMEEGN